MQTEISSAIYKTKKRNKYEEVTFAKINSFAKKNKIEIITDELNRFIETIANNGAIQKQGGKENITFNFPEQLQTHYNLLQYWRQIFVRIKMLEKNRIQATVLNQTL